jgi:hypothetical protein
MNCHFGIPNSSNSEFEGLNDITAITRDAMANFIRVLVDVESKLQLPVTAAFLEKRVPHVALHRHASPTQHQTRNLF